jgi:cardiolipin synthase
MGSVLGTILDPAADKALMTTLVVTLTMKGLVPRMCSVLLIARYIPTHHVVPLGVIVLGRDVLLSFWAFYIRFNTLPPPVGLIRSYLANIIYRSRKRSNGTGIFQ